MEIMGISFFKNKRCVNCMYLSKYLMHGNDLVGEKERELIKDKEWSDSQYNLECFQSFWSEGITPEDDIYHKVCVKDRSRCPSYFEYNSEYETFSSSLKDLEQKVKSKREKLQIIKVSIGVLLFSIPVIIFYYQEIITFLSKLVNNLFESVI